MNALLLFCIGLLTVDAVLYGTLGLYGMTAVWLLCGAAVAWLRDVSLQWR